MSVSAWIIVADDLAIENLIETARSVSDHVTAAVVGDRQVAETVAATRVDKVVWFGDPSGAPPEAYAGAVAQAIAQAAPELVVGAKRPADRVLLGAAAARLGAPAFTDAVSLQADDGRLVVQRALFGGIAEETDSISGPVALLLDGGTAPAPAATATTAAIEDHPGEPYPVTVSGTSSPESEEQVDLGSAARVVACGRGVKTEADLAIIEDLAERIKAELACSRPLAEGQSWMPKNRYIGISGRQISPELYIAIGISGQLQHMAGVRGAGTIVAINTDKDAPIFSEADYCLVGDLYTLVPALTQALVRP